MPSLSRRWFNRPGPRWVLAAALSLALVVAQTLAARHELSHLPGRAVAGQDVVQAGFANDDGTRHPAPVQADHECPLCLLAAALGGTAAGPQALTLATVETPVDKAAESTPSWAPRPLRAYASRAPPLS